MSTLPHIHLLNQKILDWFTRSEVELPPLFALWRYESGLENGRYEAVLVSTVKIFSQKGLWALNLVEDPYLQLQNASLVRNDLDRWFSDRAHHILIQRQSGIREENNRYHNVYLQYKNYVLQFQGNPQVIPVCFMSDVYSAMPIQFTNLHLPENEKYRFHLALGPIRREPVILPPRAAATAKESPILTQFIINELIEGLVARNLTCPVLMSNLTRESTRILPCGHAICLEAAEHYATGSHPCPHCRKPFVAAQLQQWK